MEKIDKFLNRRKQKTKRVLKTNNKYYEITKEDIKIIRKYKKNICLDPTVDMYIPYNLEFTKKIQETPLDFIPQGNYKIDKKKQKRNFIKKNDYSKTIPQTKNVLKDLWEEDDLEDYKQNILLDIKDQYTGKLKELKMSQEDLGKELRKTYLKQYLPRERKTLKISDILKNKNVVLNTIFPERLAKYYRVQGKCVLDEKNQFLAFYKEKNLEIYELKNFYKVYDGTVPGIISKIKFAETVKILCIVENKGTKIYNLNLTDKSIDVVSELSEVIDCAFDKFNICITPKSVKMIGTNVSLLIPKIDKLINVKTKEDLVFVTTTNSLKVYNLVKKIVINDSKIFSYILDFTFHQNLIFLVNNLKKIIIFDYERNIVIHSMVQNCDVLNITYNEVHSLLAVSTEKEILIFYINIGNNQFILTNRISGKHSFIQFDKKMPWLYGKINDKVVLYT